MKWTRLVPMLFAALFMSACSDPTLPTAVKIGPEVLKGFDDLGYNDVARIFNGPVDGVDGNIDGTYYGDPTYANDRLVMKWNKEWDRGNAEGWTNPPYAAHIDNHWNGQVPGGSGEVWYYKIGWVGQCADGSTLPDGSVCLWGQFAVLMSQGTVSNQHFWQVHAKPSGFGGR